MWHEDWFPYYYYPGYFRPDVLAKKFPLMQLWGKGCHCGYANGEQPPEAISSNVTAVRFCSTLFGKFDNQIPLGEWNGRNLANKKRKVVEKSREELTVSSCKKIIKNSENLQQLLGEASHSLRHVCEEECEELVAEVKSHMDEIADYAVDRRASWSTMCSKLAVAKVESHMLGCCGNTCGWNNRTCALSTAPGSFLLELFLQSVLKLR